MNVTLRLALSKMLIGVNVTESSMCRMPFIVYTYFCCLREAILKLAVNIPTGLSPLCRTTRPAALPNLNEGKILLFEQTYQQQLRKR